jgi:hypothetical protein
VSISPAICVYVEELTAKEACISYCTHVSAERPLGPHPILLSEFSKACWIQNSVKCSMIQSV